MRKMLYIILPLALAALGSCDKKTDRGWIRTEADLCLAAGAGSIAVINSLNEWARSYNASITDRGLEAYDEMRSSRLKPTRPERLAGGRPVLVVIEKAGQFHFSLSNLGQNMKYAMTIEADPEVEEDVKKKLFATLRKNLTIHVRHGQYRKHC